MLEVTALEELLARVISKKDRLGFENDNLKLLLQQQQKGDDGCTNNQGKMPSTIDKLDRMAAALADTMINKASAAFASASPVELTKNRSGHSARSGRSSHSIKSLVSKVSRRGNLRDKDNRLM